MIIAISVDKNKVSMHFGRCEKYYLYEVHDKYIVKKQEIKNPGHKPFFLPKFLSERGVDILITGAIGPRAIDMFEEMNIKVITGVKGDPQKIINDYLYGKLKEKTEVCEEHRN